MNESASQSVQYAVVRVGGRQERVVAGQRIIVDRMSGEKGDAVTLGDILVIGGNGTPTIGAPFISGAAIQAKIVRQLRAPKVTIFKKRRRKGYLKKQGHRQDQTEIVVEAIKGA